MVPERAEPLVFLLTVASHGTALSHVCVRDTASALRPHPPPSSILNMHTHACIHTRTQAQTQTHRCPPPWFSTKIPRQAPFCMYFLMYWMTQYLMQFAIDLWSLITTEPVVDAFKAH